MQHVEFSTDPSTYRMASVQALLRSEEGSSEAGGGSGEFGLSVRVQYRKDT